MLSQCRLLSLAQLAVELVAQQLTEVCLDAQTFSSTTCTLLETKLGLDTASETSEDQ